MRIGYFGCLCLLVESQSAYPVNFAVNASMDRAICCLYPVHYAVNGKIDRGFCCLFPVHYAVNGKIDRGFCSHFPVHYAVNASMDRDLLLYIKVHCLYWRTMKSGRTIMQEFSAYIGQMMNGSRIAREKSCCLGFVVFFHNMS